MALEIGFTNRNEKGLLYKVVGKFPTGSYIVEFEDGSVRENISKKRVLSGKVNPDKKEFKNFSCHIGQRFDNLVVIGLDNPLRPEMVCDCGNNYSATRSRLFNGLVSSCGCVPSKRFSEKFWKNFSSFIQKWDGTTEDPSVMKLPVFKMRGSGVDGISLHSFSLVDKEFYDYWIDYPFISGGRGYVSLSSNRYVFCKIKGFFKSTDSKVSYRLHHLVYGCTNFSNYVIDHIDGDRSNNTRVNLRLATKQENGRNRNKHKTDTTSKYKGVFFNHRTAHKEGEPYKPWKVQLVFDGKCFNKSCETEKEAALAYNELAMKYHGEFARLNIVEEGE